MVKRILKFSLMGIGSVLIVGVVLVALFVFTRPDEPIDVNTQVGLIERTFTDTERERTLNTYLWFPAQQAGSASLVNSNGLFFGFSAKTDSTPAVENAPLVILSHGSGGNISNQGWLAVELAKQGAVVVALNHPGSTSRDSAASTNIQAWNRPQDIQFLLNELLSDETTKPLIDDTRIAIVGHSLGGYTALATGGARLSKAAFIQYCDRFMNNPDCQFFRSGGVDLNEIDAAQFENDHTDERIKAIVALDPAYAMSFQADSLQNLPPVLLVTPEVVPDSLDDLQVGFLREQLANSEHAGLVNLVIPGAHHFSFLSRCKPFASFIMGVVEKGAGALCAHENGASRSDVQNVVTQDVITFLTDHKLL